MNALNLLAAASPITVCIPAHAGSDWAALEQARKARSSAAAAAALPTAAAPNATCVAHAHQVGTAAAACSLAAPTLWPDHGPRAATTRQAGQARLAQYRVALSACAVASR